MGEADNQIPNYKGYLFVSDERLEGDKFAYKLNKGTKRIFVSPALYEALDDDLENTMEALSIKDLSDYAINEISNPVLQSLKQYDTNEQIKEIESKSKVGSTAEDDEVADGDKIRMLITITDLYCDVDNTAPDFVDPELDELKVSPVIYDQQGKVLVSTGKEFPLEYEGYIIEKQLRHYRLEESKMWFDLDLEKAKEAWLGNVEFVLKSDYSRYLDYQVTEVQYQLQWLEKDENTDSYRSLSMTKKVFKPQSGRIGESSSNGHYSTDEVVACASKLSQAIEQIDLRMRAAYIQLDFEDDKYRKLFSELAGAMGYQLEALDDNVRQNLGNELKNATHILSLK